MKIPTKRFDLTELGYEGFWIEAPRSVKEGWFNQLAKETRQTRNQRPEDRDPEVDRKSNLRVMELVTAWNLTDEEGEAMPLIRELATYEEKTAVLSEVPMDVILHVVKSVLGGDQAIPERTRDF